MEVAVADAESDVLHVGGAHVLAMTFGRDPCRALHQADGLVVAAAAHRVDDDDVGDAAVFLHHEAQSHGALDFTFLGLGGELHV